MSNKTRVDRDPDVATGPVPGGQIGLEQVRIALQAIRFGEVRVIIQDGVIVQIDRIEKQRLR
jgi:hypothetical protein